MRPDHSLDASYFDDVFASDDDPWSLASSAYEAEKYAASVAAIADRRYRAVLEIGCAHGVLTRHVAPLCDTLLAIDISQRAVDLARRRCADLDTVTIERAAFPRQLPDHTPMTGFDLVLLSEVAYYWDDGDIARAAAAVRTLAAPECRILLVHWTGTTDYPQTGDEAVAKLQRHIGAITVERAERTAEYRLDLWQLA